MNARKSSVFLYLIAKLRPEAIDGIIPHGPRVSRASREYLIAQALKGFSAEMGNADVTQKLKDVQKTLVSFASENLAASFDDDNWCGTPVPGRFRVPQPEPVLGFSFEDVLLNPQPLPPKELQREIGGYLVMLSEATAHEGAAKNLKAIGNSLIGAR